MSTRVSLSKDAKKLTGFFEQERERKKDGGRVRKSPPVDQRPRGSFQPRPRLLRVRIALGSRCCRVRWRRVRPGRWIAAGTYGSRSARPDPRDDEGRRFPRPPPLGRRQGGRGPGGAEAERVGYRRSVMARLRAMGHDAAICKARWEKSGGVMAGGHEYIDVVVDAERRYIVDLGFAAEFAVARATPEYEKVVAALPELMVASLDEVRQAVQMVGKAARRSLEARGLHVPPWRTGRYMMAKWLGPYRRIVNAVPSSAGVPVVGGGEGNCRGLRFAAARAALGIVIVNSTYK
ncbi:hypothetical protein Cni_G20731 [Canna indica]|uniref:Uncharacterized protein n=1 Tax=Canna indica TaxID=4628 RepID=A0AAQ3KN67_9LILI|nr:hypothetical protein Cni_G20731 [Canna indica]